MKDAILAEVQHLEESTYLLDRRRGRTIRLVLESIRCVTCLDTRRCWKDRDGLPWCALDGQGRFDIVGCSECNPCGWLSCSYTSDIHEHGIRVYHKNDRDWRDRMIEIYAKGDSDSFIVDEVERWLIAPSASLIDASPVIEPVEPSTPPVPAPVPVPTPAVEPLFSICKRLSRDYREETVEAELEVGKIVNAVKDVVEAYFGDTFSLMDLCKQLTVSFTMSDNQSVSHDKIIRISENNYLGIKTCTRLTDQKLSLGIMKGSRLAKEFQAEIFILQPLNQAAVEKAQQIMSKIATEMTDEILEHF